VTGAAVASVKQFIIRHFALSIYLLIYLLVVVAILPPTGDALLTDDCDYSITVFNWLETGKLHLSDFPSMTLIGHLSWGAAFAKVFGSSQVVLRASTMVMVWLGGLAIYSLTLAHQRSPRFAALCAATYVFNPFTLFYAYTFNTDVAGCSMMLVFLALVQRTGNASSALSFAGLGMIASFCFLIRQTAAIPAILYGAVLVFLVVTRRLHWSKLVLYGSAFAILPAAYFVWLLLARDLPVGYEKRFLVFWQLFHVKIMTVKLLRMSLALGLYTFPLALACIKFRTKDAYRWSLGLIALLGCTFAFQYFDRLKPIRPYWSQEFYEGGFGKKPEVLGLETWIQSPRIKLPLTDLSSFESIIIPLSFLSLFCWLYLIGTRIKKSFATLHELKFSSFDLQRLLMVSTFASQWFVIVAVWDVYDRYFMPLFSIAIVLLAIWLLSEPFPLKWSNALLFLSTVVGLLAVQDSRCQNEAAWQLAKHLGKRGIPAESIWIGHQFFGTHVYLPAFYRQLATVDGDVRRLDRDERGKLLKVPSNIRYIVRQGPGSKAKPAIARLQFSSWIRKYDFYAIPAAE
jgi:Dolichyl-phosphate-mannose-protein mannosyltransferase